MFDLNALERLSQAQASALVEYDEVFAKLLPLASASHDRLNLEAARRLASVRALQVQPTQRPAEAAGKITDRRADHAARLHETFVRQLRRAGTEKAAIRSPLGAAFTLQPVRDVVVDDVTLIGEDRRLDVIGGPYIGTWTQMTGDGAPSERTTWADLSARTMGFEHLVTGRHDESGAGLFFRFKPRIGDAFAQVRPYLPYSFAWSDLSFKSAESNFGGFGIRVWSGDGQGGDLRLDQHFFYFAWQDRIAADYFASTNSPSWDENPGRPDLNFDFDTAFLYGDSAPYLAVDPNRFYVVAVWCAGAIESGGERPGQAIGKLHAEMPWAVVGYR